MMSGSRASTVSSTAGVLALSVALGGTGTALAFLSQTPPLTRHVGTWWYLLIPAYVLVQHLPIDFEFRKESLSVPLVQLPLALGVVLVSSTWHLAAAVAGALIDSAFLRREKPLKAAFNVAVAAFSVGTAAAAVQAVGTLHKPGPSLWIALFVGLLIGEVGSSLAVIVVMRLVGVRTTAAEALQPLTFSVFTTTLFTGLAVVAISAVWTEPLSILVIGLLAVGLSLAYRGHRRMSAQQQVTESLYDFVKDLGPLHPSEPATVGVLQHVRELLHASELELLLSPSLDRAGQRLSVTDDAQVAHPTTDDPVDPPLTGAPSSPLRPPPVELDHMTTHLSGTAGVLGVLTATGRLGAVRSFDMGDLRLLETIANELAVALERGRLLEDLGRAATTDSLTDLPNMAETSRLISAQLGHGDVLLAAVAVDSFREVNDTLGHQVGDALLLEVTRRLLLTPGAVVGRIGGGRFALSVPADVAGHDPEMFGLDIRSQVEGTARVGPIGTHIRLSVGVVQAPVHGTEASTLLRRAETAMSSARDVHGGPVVWEPAYEVKGQRRLAVVTALREALVTGAIGLAYQPKVDAITDGTTGVEALARWTHPALGAIGPDEFIPLAEASGLMGALTSTVLRQALTACKGWQRRAPNVGVAVNVSADTALDPAFVTEVGNALADAGLAADLLTLELTESVVVGDPRLAAVRLGELRHLGVKVSVDDFGTGYSSLTYLKGLPVDEVKIDKGFVDRITVDAADRAVVRGVVDIAHTLGLRVVAEGVEEQAQHDLLRSLGVDEIQGYLHARPMAALDAALWLRKREAGAAGRSARVGD